jgi:hypothetical protein
VNIGFLLVDRGDSASELGYECAREMVRSAKAVMPFTPIVQFTDETSPGVKGVKVKRKPSEPMGLLRLRHCAGVPGDWLFVDTDILFKQGVDSVFKKVFDIAVTKRDWPHLRPALGFSDRMPFNTGVVFSRCPAFWAEAYMRLLATCDFEKQHFMGEQEVINEMALEDGSRYNVRRLSGAAYNFPPIVPGKEPTAKELEENAKIIHYKGPERKAMMLGRRRCA